MSNYSRVAGIESIANDMPYTDLRGNTYDEETATTFHHNFRDVLGRGDPSKYAERFHIGYYVAISFIDAANLKSATDSENGRVSLADRRKLSLADFKPETDLRRFYGWDDDMFGLLECTVNDALHKDGVCLIGDFENANNWNDCYQATLRNYNRPQGHIGPITKAIAACSSMLKLIRK